MAQRRLSPDEAALWARVMAEVRPIAGRRASHTAPAKPIVASEVATPRERTQPDKVATASKQAVRGMQFAAPVKSPPPPKPATPANTLDGTWDRQLSRGLVAPDRTIDLHGHTLHSAYDLLDAALDAAVRHGDRVILLVTGKPPRPASDRPLPPGTFRGAIRAATGDWLAGSRHAAAIAAVRAAHPRHGGKGALYIVLKRSRPASGPLRKS